MRVGLYARVSTEGQEARGTIGSQLEALRSWAVAEGHEVVGEFVDDGHSGARLDRPGLDALRDAAETGAVEAVACLSVDRLARSYAYQVIVLEEFGRHAVRVLFLDTPPLDDPQARLLTQVQGVIAEYERAKITERYRRGKLYRSRLGEVIAWKAPYGYRRIPRGAHGPARLEIYEAEARVVRRVFEDYVAGGYSMRQIARRLATDGVPSPTGRTCWGTSMVGRLLRNEAYVGRVYFNRTESLPAPPGARSRYVQRPRPQEEWIAIPVPSLISEDRFEAAQKVTRDNSQWSPRRAEPGAWLLRGLLKCGICGVRTSCHKMRGRNGTVHRYYYCVNHDPVRARGEHRRCPERNIRADELDAFVFEHVRQALLRPDVLVAGETALETKRPAPDDELLAQQVGRLSRRLEAARLERKRIVDLYQAGVIERSEVQRRVEEIDRRRHDIEREQEHLAAAHKELAVGHRLRQRVGDFARRVLTALEGLDFTQRQRLLRMVVEEVRVARVQVTIHLAVPLDQPPDPSPHGSPRTRSPGGPDKLSSDMRLRSLDGHGRGQLPAEAPAGADGHRSKGIDAGRQRSWTKEDGLIRGVSRVGPSPDRRAAAILRGRSCLNGALIRQEPLGSVETAGSAQRVGNGR